MSNCKECFDKGICCQTHDFTLTKVELEKGMYKSEDGRLLRTVIGDCVYLNAWGKCSIHYRRPQSCKDFKCLNLDGGDW